MNKRNIIRILEEEVGELEDTLVEDDPPRGTKAKIKRIKAAIGVIEELPPTCKRCKDTMIARNYEGEAMDCPECNAYGVNS